MIDVIITDADGVAHRVEVTQPLGSGGGFHVMVDRYYQGAIVRRPDGWCAYLKSALLTGDDVRVILDMINESGV